MGELVITDPFDNKDCSLQFAAFSSNLACPGTPSCFVSLESFHSTTQLLHYPTPGTWTSQCQHSWLAHLSHLNAPSQLLRMGVPTNHARVVRGDPVSAQLSLDCQVLEYVSRALPFFWYMLTRWSFAPTRAKQLGAIAGGDADRNSCAAVHRSFARHVAASMAGGAVQRMPLFFGSFEWCWPQPPTGTDLVWIVVHPSGTKLLLQDLIWKLHQYGKQTKSIRDELIRESKDGNFISLVAVLTVFAQHPYAVPLLFQLCTQTTRQMDTDIAKQRFAESVVDVTDVRAGIMPVTVPREITKLPKLCAYQVARRNFKYFVATKSQFDHHLGEFPFVTCCADVGRIGGRGLFLATMHTTDGLAVWATPKELSRVRTRMLASARSALLEVLRMVLQI